jgi:sulfane dehydrogenase subunit SoxC
MSRPGHPRSPRHRRPQDAAAQEPPREDPAPDDSTPAQAASGGGALDAAVPRRTVLLGAAGAVGAAVLESLRLPKPLAGTTEVAGAPQARPVPADPTRVQGPPPSELGQRSPFERPRRHVGTITSLTPHQDLFGTITPTDLHFERHHGGVAMVDPERYTLLVHGMVERPLTLTLADLRSFPSVSRICFLECSGNYWRDAPEEATPQRICGLTSQQEWTGVPLSTVFRETGILDGASWFLAEGMDAAVMTRSIPLGKAFDDALIAYAQNGEPLRPEHGYPARLFLPGWEGNASVKWLRRIEVSDRPFMTREETSRYAEPIRGGKARQFSMVMDARSIITAPCYPAAVRPGWIEIRGIAWSGRGAIARAELSFDEGRTWVAADLQEPVLPKAHTRFRYLWRWDGREATVLSRATDDTGYVQPTVREIIDARGRGTSYHLNPITGWRIRPDGNVVYRQEAWE